MHHASYAALSYGGMLWHDPGLGGLVLGRGGMVLGCGGIVLGLGRMVLGFGGVGGSTPPARARVTALRSGYFPSPH
jgi:hypothetical protein